MDRQVVERSFQTSVRCVFKMACRRSGPACDPLPNPAVLEIKCSSCTASILHTNPERNAAMSPRPKSKDDISLDILCQIYTAEKSDSAAHSSIVVTLVSVFFAYVLAATALIGSRQANHIPSIALALSPIIPFSLLAWIALLLADLRLRRYYIIAIESLIREKLNIAPHNGPHVPSWSAISAQVWAPTGEKKHPTRYAIANIVWGVGALISVAAFTTGAILAGVHNTWGRILISSAYLGVYAVIVAVLWPGRKFWQKAIAIVPPPTER